MGVRLKGGMFEREFNGLRFQLDVKEREHSVYEHRISKNKRKLSDEQVLATGIEIKEAYHQERYKSSAVPEPLASDKVVQQELEVAKPDHKETYSPSFRPGF